MIGKFHMSHETSCCINGSLVCDSTRLLPLFCATMLTKSFRQDVGTSRSLKSSSRNTRATVRNVLNLNYDAVESN